MDGTVIHPSRNNYSRLYCMLLSTIGFHHDPNVKLSLSSSTCQSESSQLVTTTYLFCTSCLWTRTLRVAYIPHAVWIWKRVKEQCFKHSDTIKLCDIDASYWTPTLYFKTNTTCVVLNQQCSTHQNTYTTPTTGLQSESAVVKCYHAY